MILSMQRAKIAWVALSLLGATACGDSRDPGGPDLTPDPVPGTAAILDFDADLSDPTQFYDLPYPCDVRLDADGRSDHRGFPGQLGNRLLRPIVALAGERQRSPVTPFAYVRFDGPLADRDADDWIAASPTSPVLLLGIDVASRDYARLLPTVASTLPPDSYAPAHLLAVAVPAGIVLEPNATYAFVILRSLGDAAGEPLGVPASFARLRAGLVPDGSRGTSAAQLYAPLWDALDAAGVRRAEVAAATVFSTTDVVAELAELSARVRAQHPIEIEDLHVDPLDGADHERFCELRGSARVPMFQAGEPPYDRDGRFEYASTGLPIVQREEAVPLTITLPRTPMPEAGFPLLLYFHGTGGASDQVVQRGRVSVPGGTPAAGEGPAHVVAAHGLAAFQSAQPLNPERYTGPVGISGRSYLNISNLGAYPDTFRQSTIEQQWFLDALAELEIDPEVVAACELDRPARGGFRFRTDRVYAMGQSLGGQLVNMVGAVDPRVVGVVPTGSGGYWAKTIVAADFAPGLDSKFLLASLLTIPVLRDHLHPGLQIIQSAFEPAEPMVFAARLSRDPLPGHRPRAIYQPIGIDDPGFPNPIYNAMAVASGTHQVGEVLHPDLQRALAWVDADGVLPYAVSANARSRDGEPYTGAVVQFSADGVLDSHHIFAQLDEVKHQYGCFLRSLLDGGPGIVSQPATLGSACP